MNLIKKSTTLFLIIFLFQSCANYKLNYSHDAKNWKERTVSSDLKIKHSIYLIGDAGNAKKGKSIPLFGPLKQELSQASENSSIIFLGDNIYPVGMPPKSHEEERDLAEHKLNVQLDMLEDFKGNIMFIPGNHDWAEYGLKGLSRQERYIEKHLNTLRNGTDDDEDKNWEEYFFPNKGCGDPKVIEINEQLVVVLVDSEWWLRDWNIDQSINEGCETKTRAGFYREFEEIVRKYRNKNVLIAMHHPLYSNGQHGGHYTANNHIFPLRFINKGLHIPLPVLGSAIAFFRGTIGVPQDLANAKYKDMKSDMLTALRKNGSYIIASGHEHTLQYIERDNQQFIISGSGSKENAASTGSDGDFAYGRLGYSKIDFYEDGSAWLYFYAMNDAKNSIEEVYRKKIKEKLKISKDNIPEAFPEFDKKETVKVRKPNNFEFDKVGFVHKAIFGTHYSDLYLKNYTFNVLDLSTFKGGVLPVKRGGGNQTNSLRLQSVTGHQYSMRSLTKDASRALLYPFNQMQGAKNTLQDNFMAAHPFAALMVPDMAEAAGIFHTNPQLYYVPKQPTLGYHNDLFGGDVYLIEERPAGDWSELESFGNSSKIISTLDVIEKITKNRKHRVDQKQVVRSRLFDLMIKDWDRHEDQWRWATFKDEKGKVYKPIPRDRDQPFAKYDGLLTWVIYAVNPFMRQLQTYSPDTKNVKWQGWNATYFDQTFLSELEWEDWEKEAKFIQENVTDQIIETAFSRIPDAAKNSEWKQMMEDTKKRRDRMVKFARQVYELKSKVVDVLGTDKRDLFEVNRMSDTQTSVKVFALSKNGNKKDLAYERVFDHAVTKEIHLYGLADDDEFIITGDVNKSLKIRLIGGVDNDKFVDNSNVKSGGKKTLVYDSSIKDNDLSLGKEGKDKTSRNVNLNTYDRRSLHYNPDWWMPLPVISSTPDDGLILGTDLSFFHYAFKKHPYAQKHNFRVDYSFGTAALNFKYRGEYLQSIKNWDLVNNVSLRRSRFAFNYFGIGNETVNIDPDDLEFNRVRQSVIYVDLQLRKQFANNNGSFSIGPLVERTKVESTSGRFISLLNETNLPSDIFEQRIYSGVKTQFSYESLDQTVNPHRGLKFYISYALETNIENTDFTFGKFSTGLTIYQNLDKKGNIIIASKAGYEHISGDYDFFKAPTIGGGNNIRGFRAQRFRGDASFYHITDLRIKLLRSINKTIPFTFGIHGGFDYGKVWEKGVDSDKIHTSYGGGIWLDPVDFLIISVGQYYSEEDKRFLFKLTHMF